MKGELKDPMQFKCNDELLHRNLMKGELKERNVLYCDTDSLLESHEGRIESDLRLIRFIDVNYGNLMKGELKGREAVTREGRFSERGIS